MNTFRPLFYLTLLTLFFSCNLEKKADPGLYINEFISSNSAYGVDTINYYHSDWIEIYNAYDYDLDLSGYYLSDDQDEPEKWTFPKGSTISSKGFFIVWADGLDSLNHSNFKLSKAGGEIILSTNEKAEIDFIDYPSQALNISMGRKWDGVDEWLYYDLPNPLLTNNDVKGAEKIEYSSAPLFSVNAGFYDSSLELEINSEKRRTEIRFTLNGDIPTRKSKLYKEKIQIDSTMVIRAACFENGKLKSNTVTKTYFLNVDKELPIFSLVSDTKALWEDSSGIYQRSFRGIERMANIEFFENKEEILNQEIDISISGNVARKHGQKALVLEAKSKYGKEAMEYRFFPNKRVYKYKSILLRAGGHPDKYNTMFKDGYGGYITEDYVAIDHSAYRPAVLYLNGEYWGIYNIREKVNNNFIIDNHRLHKEAFSFLQNCWAIERNGSREHYSKSMDFITSCNKEDANNYKKVKELFDIDNYIDYMIIEMYAANIDWPSWNIKFWREEAENAKWKWILLDLDFAFGTGAKADFNMMEYASSPVKTRVTNPPLSTKLFRNLLQFDEFKNEFIQRFAASLNEIYRTERLETILTEFRNERVAEMPFQIDKWSESIFYSKWGKFKIVDGIESWDKKINEISEFNKERPDYIRTHIKNYFKIKELVNVETIATNGKIYINTIRIDSSGKKGIYFSDVEMKIKARPDAGYQVDHWLINGKIIEANELYHFPNEGDRIEAVFKRVSTSILPCDINEDMRLTAEGSPYYGLCDIKVNKGAQLIIDEGVDLYMNDYTSIIINGGLRILGSPDNNVNILPNPENESKEWGALCIEDAESEIEMTHLNLIKSSWFDNKIKFKASITSINSDINMDHVAVESADFPFYSEYGNISIKNSTLTSPKTCDMINIKYAESAIVEGCTLPGNYYPDTDAIDYDQIHNGIIRNNTIYGFFGFNSDAIDIGEASSNILIEGNKIYNMSDKGISVGQESSVIIKNNLIYGCQMGVGIKDANSFATISGTTFLANKYGVATFEKNENSGGGSAEVSYCIFYKSRKNSVYVDSKSKINISYSLSDKEAFKGKGNRTGDPEFNDVTVLDLEVNTSSSSLNSGPDNNFTMGYPIKIDQNPNPKISIKDHYYNFTNNENPYLYIELHNESDQNIDLSNYTITNDNYHAYPLPYRYILKAGERMIITNNTNKYLKENPAHLDVRDCIGKRLISKGSMLRLYDGQMNLLSESKILNKQVN